MSQVPALSGAEQVVIAKQERNDLEEKLTELRLQVSKEKKAIVDLQTEIGWVKIQLENKNEELRRIQDKHQIPKDPTKR